MNNELEQLTEKAKTYFLKKQYQQAVDGFTEILETLKQTGTPQEIAEIRNNLGVALLNSSKPQEALDAVLGTDSVFADAHDSQRQGIALANIASAQEALKQYDLAAAAYEGAIACFKESGDKKLRSITLRSLSDLQLKTGNQYVALATLQASYAEKPGGNFKDRFFASALGRVIKKLIGQ